ncbi:MAG: 4Fe-4S dicluster domain-containing protein [Candidatus Lokiarchaeota archaeon]|nr:4Fe-4S dicluster domain-containing protein [Candidatus Lokiarchaeota archaeon]MBD3200949.1 4Fe-4S dicluster domain-containing protein [Candidatus Lokiarchaeota archaeon]
MTIINITIPLGLIQQIEDYSRIVNDILKHDVSLNILKFSTSSGGINILLDLPEEKIKEITESLKSNDVQINRKGRISYDQEKCLFCGACISLCPTEALRYKDDDSIEFSEGDCIGCLLCVDACPTNAIMED